MNIAEMIDLVRVRALQEAVLATDRSDIQPSRHLSELIHSAAVQCLMHAEKHGDVSSAKRLHQVCDESLVESRSLLIWFARFSPIFLGDSGELKLCPKTHENYREFNVDAAKDHPLAETGWPMVFKRLAPAEIQRAIASPRDPMKLGELVDAVRDRAVQEAALATLNRMPQSDERQQLEADIVAEVYLDPIVLDGARKSHHVQPSRFLAELIHSTGVQCLMHAEKHGDLSFVNRLRQVCDESLVDSRSLLIWFAKFSPIVLNDGGGLKLRSRDHRNYQPFDADAAKMHPLAEAGWPVAFKRLTPAGAQRAIASLHNAPKAATAFPASLLAQLGPEGTKQLWLDAIRVQASDPSPARRDAARMVLDAIEEVWLVRSRGAPEGWFAWPTTYASAGPGGLSGELWLAEGPLKFLGYSVGEDAAPPEVRRGILGRVFEGPLPPVFPPDYLDVWGDPGSPARLKKMADSIASFARSKKRHDAVRFAQAIRDWESDLGHLHRTYYVGRFGFGWPTHR
jgi:hypothetical protein